MNLGRDLAGVSATLTGTGPTANVATRPTSTGWPFTTWAGGFLFSPALTVGGGTAEVQRNIVAEQVLGLPRDPS
jgi:hypothetical protein